MKKKCLWLRLYITFIVNRWISIEFILCEMTRKYQNKKAKKKKRNTDTRRWQTVGLILFFCQSVIYCMDLTRFFFLVFRPMQFSRKKTHIFIPASLYIYICTDTHAHTNVYLFCFELPQSWLNWFVRFALFLSHSSLVHHHHRHLYYNAHIDFI